MKKYEFNAKGLACPLPVIQTKKILTEYDTVVTTVDNFIATQNLQKLANQLNYNYDLKEISKEEYIVTISKEEVSKDNKEEKTAVVENKVQTTLQKNTDYSYIVIVNKQFMGHGSEELGQRLIKSYFYALSEQEKLPEKIIFYNGGAHLVDSGSFVLEEIKNLENLGVEIVCCGACIDYYKIDLGVGSSTNMYFIIEEMRTANKIIHP